MGKATKNTTTEKELLIRLEKLMGEKSLRAIQRENFSEISLPTLSRIGNGQFPKTKRIRELLGLPLLVSVNCCTNCGGAHPIRKCSPRKKKVTQVLSGSREDIAVIKSYIEFFKSVELNMHIKKEVLK